ncbi:MAG TPA: tRNA uridine-5-carboxymethylaminomethyl(34) synthesis GTPase MnmE, partial [Cyclobacteriaceae bacterium]|nr:tRNA uridine-5-carboxymethylaminomethyl(34) synthesis GTPase MnmE [Cyclobacteriaceae bacterium]
DLASRPSHTAHVGLLRDGEQVLDEAVVSIFRAPKSYTGENVAEISSHGSPYVAEQIIQACIKRGARLAKPGEFTQRAFLNGKMDLAQAEAVADLIASNTAASRKAAIDNLRGGFSGELAELREKLITFSALIELELDFSEEDVEFADRKRFNELVDHLQNTTRRLLDSFALGNVVKNGVQVAIIGKPNAGKSTLLNALLNENRAIVSAIAGTTRDTIEEVVNIGGILFRLVDTAGIRAHTTDDIETIGVERAKEKMRQASLVIYLFDVQWMPAEELAAVETEFRAEQIKYILAGNKSEDDRARWEEKFSAFPSILYIAAKEQLGIDSLKRALVEKVIGGALQTEATLVTNARHYEALQKLEQSLADIKRGLSDRLPGDLLSLDIRHALHWLGEITGEITNEDQLDYIFSKFCIGK